MRNVNFCFRWVGELSAAPKTQSSITYNVQTQQNKTKQTYKLGTKGKQTNKQKNNKKGMKRVFQVKIGCVKLVTLWNI